MDIPDSLITHNDSYIPWDNLKSQIEDSGLVRKDEVIAILEEEARLVDYHHPNMHIDNRIVKKLQSIGRRQGMAADEQTLLRANAKCLCGIRNLQERVTTRARACNRA